MSFQTITARFNSTSTVPRKVGARQIIHPSRRDMLDLMTQSAWSLKEKFWFEAPYSTVGISGAVDTVRGWLRGLDGLPQYLTSYPGDTTGAQNVGLYTGADDVATWAREFPIWTETAAFTATISGTSMTVSSIESGALAVNDIIRGEGIVGFPRVIAPLPDPGPTGVYTLSLSQTVGSPTAMTGSTANVNFGTLLSSANAKIPPAEDGVSKCTIAMLAQFAPQHNGIYFCGDDGDAGLNQMAIGTPLSDDRFYAYSNINSNLFARTIPNVHTGELCTLLVEFDGASAVMRLNGSILTPSGASTVTTVTSQRFRVGTQRLSAGTPFNNPADMALYNVLAFPDVSSDIRLAFKNLCLADHSGMVIA